VNVRIADTTADVFFSIAYIAFESVATACTVAWWGTILGRVERPPRLPPMVRVPVAILAVSEMVVFARESVRLGIGAVVSVSVDGRTTPVRAWKMSATGGCGSSQGTVKRGLSQRLWVLGSS
jgi:hypothetical protein